MNNFKELQELRNIINELSDKELADYADELIKITTIEGYEPTEVTSFEDKVVGYIKDDDDMARYMTILASVYAERWLNK